MTRTRARRRVTLPTVEIIDPTDARLAKGDLVPIIDQYGRRPADSMRYRVRTAIEKAYDDERISWEQLEAARSYYRDAYHVERPSVAMMHWRDLVDGARGETQFDTEFHRARLARVRKRLGPRLTRVMNLAVVHDASFVMIGTEIAGRNNQSQAWAVGFELVVTALDMAKDEYGIGKRQGGKL
jgi:hypothetical protein